MHRTGPYRVTHFPRLASCRPQHAPGRPPSRLASRSIQPGGLPHAAHSSARALFASSLASRRIARNAWGGRVRHVWRCFHIFSVFAASCHADSASSSLRAAADVEGSYALSYLDSRRGNLRTTYNAKGKNQESLEHVQGRCLERCLVKKN